MSAATHSTQGTPYYFIPQPSRHPAMVALAMFLVILGAGQWVNGASWGKYSVLLGLALWAVIMFQWFGDAIGESEGKLYSDRVDLSFRWSMSWFIFSEVMFFAAFFGALYWARAHALPMLGNLEHQILWPDFKAVWPSAGPGITASPAGTVEPARVPLPRAHPARLGSQRAKTVLWMWITVALGVTFLFVQAYEYMHAYRDLNLKLSSGIFGSTFFMLTGFHGFHVCVGALMLIFITLRIQKGHFTPERHFGFEGAAWYWHFVDVVWLGLYIVVYWL